MNVEFRKSFEKDIGKIRDGDLLGRIKAVIEEVENAESLLDVNNIKRLKATLRRKCVSLEISKIYNPDS
ncbi:MULTISPECIES: hypothetical protein [Kamptonema]|uniref:hypothetical protein n=1 Tax=Kamptonema TaxID=1501433 RepID=UPI0001DAD45A|nr:MULTISPECIES: hypothetical protein [Kamptonema]CBN54713.1 hypothetical protein OSCI_1030006 [Kamptonema sp. PCC 6506]